MSEEYFACLTRLEKSFEVVLSLVSSVISTDQPVYSSAEYLFSSFRMSLSTKGIRPLHPPARF